MTSPLRPLLDDSSGLLAGLERRAGEVLSLTNTVKQTLQGPEREHVIAAVFHEDTLVITMDSAAWTAQVRFAIDELRSQLVARGEKTFVGLKVRVGME